MLSSLAALKSNYSAGRIGNRLWRYGDEAWRRGHLRSLDRSGRQVAQELDVERSGARLMFMMSSGGSHGGSRRIEEEGVHIDNFQFVSRGRFCERELRALLSGAPAPLPCGLC